MRAASLQRETVSLSLILASGVLVVGLLAGHTSEGAAAGIGVIVGCLNGFMIQNMLDRRAPILVTSFLRLAFLSLTALVAASIAGWAVWPVVSGVALAQLAMVAVSVRRGIRS